MRHAMLCGILLASWLQGVSAQTGSEATPSPTNISPAPTISGHNWHLRLESIHGTAGYERGAALDPYEPYGYGPSSSPTAWAPFGDRDSSYVPDLSYGRDKGEVKLTDVPKNAKVYLDGAYAGSANHLKHIWLEPGAYDLAVATPDRETFQQRIYVLGGKTLKIPAIPAQNLPESSSKEEKP